MSVDVKRLDGAEGFFEVVEKRHSVRRYKEYDIPDEDLKKILDAARLAPSANNSQPWRFIVVKDEETKKLLAEPRPQTFIADANAIVVVLGDVSVSCCNRATWVTRDPMIATEHLVLAATAMGYGACWIAMYESRPQEFLDRVRRRLKIPDNMHIVCLAAIGVPETEPRPTPKKALEDICFAEEFEKPLFQ
ncbi:MAG: nitroreductase family protein [Candidatus Bathyarchaeota archaeon]|nr:MAG: nitroreductase family protein [Candidatus Bathyarchaeota archaeon]